VCCPAIGRLGGIHDYFGQCRLKISFCFNKKDEAPPNWLFWAAQTGSCVKQEPVCG